MLRGRSRSSMKALYATTEISVDWTYEYNTLNQLKTRHDGASWSGADGDARWSYEYDANGNLTQAMEQEKISGPGMKNGCGIPSPLSPGVVIVLPAANEIDMAGQSTPQVI
ncbi:MAG: RHS repeat protein [Candidatus Omnitrophica bacterium]|nr:RHS repeat protein [Candidatus Omnitrophota bacterium]